MSVMEYFHITQIDEISFVLNWNKVNGDFSDFSCASFLHYNDLTWCNNKLILLDEMTKFISEGWVFFGKNENIFSGYCI